MTHQERVSLGAVSAESARTRPFRVGLVRIGDQLFRRFGLVLFGRLGR